MSPMKRVAVIGTGPSGAIAVDALVQEGAFDVVRVFERQEKAGGNWYLPTPKPSDLNVWDFANEPCAGYREKPNRRNH